MAEQHDGPVRSGEVGGISAAIRELIGSRVHREIDRAMSSYDLRGLPAEISNIVQLKRCQRLLTYANYQVDGHHSAKTSLHLLEIRITEQLKKDRYTKAIAKAAKLACKEG